MGGIHNQVAEQIQVLGPIVHKDVSDMVNIGCGRFRGLETQLCCVRDIQGQLVHGVNQLANAVDRKLI